MKDSRNQLIAPTLDDLVNDVRLSRLFSKDSRHCALQLWVLQLRLGELMENRIVYGRLLPYGFSNNRWSVSEDDKFLPLGTCDVQIVRLNLYLNSADCAHLLRSLCAGRTISAISKELNLSLSDAFERRFGDSALAADELLYRPTAYLLNRDGHDRLSPSSPHNGAGAFSASIMRADKGALFRIDQQYDVALTACVVKQLNEDTGLDFGGTDTARFGDLELLVFPALDDEERSLLTVSWQASPFALVVKFNPMQVPYFDSFQFRLCVSDGGQISYSSIAIADCDNGGEFRCTFELGEDLRARKDRIELEIFGFDINHWRQGILCCRWRVDLIREIHLNLQAVGTAQGPVRFDWLEKTTRISDVARVKSALTMGRGDLSTKSQIGGRQADPWVPVNGDLTSLFARLHPSKSQGRFFQRWSQGPGDGRLQFVEWFKDVLRAYPQHQIVIFDPYFEYVGLGLLLLYAEPQSDYIVFTSLPKLSKAGDARLDGATEAPSGRIDNLLASCEQNRDRLRYLKLRIYGLKEGRLHDRYILILAADGLPAAGFNLSNSFQKAAENFPLLVTPIPADTLLEVEKYKSDLVREAGATRPDRPAGNPPMELLFQAGALPAIPFRYEPLRSWEKAEAGNVLSIWIGESSLKGLSGDGLKERMTELGLIKDDRLALAGRNGLLVCIRQQLGDFSNFEARWDVIGDVLATTHSEGDEFQELERRPDFLEFLKRSVRSAFQGRHDWASKEIEVLSNSLFRDTLEMLLHKSLRIDDLLHPTKYAGLSWADFFAIKLLWHHAPGALITIAEEHAVAVPAEPQSQDMLWLALLGQIVSEVSHSVLSRMTELQKSLLVHSSNALLSWIGLNAIERALDQPEEQLDAWTTIAAFADREKVQALGWMIARAAKSPERGETYRKLVASLQDALPTPIPRADLKWAIDAMRGHMGKLGWAEPWLSQDIVFPLVQAGRASVDDACEIWSDELTMLLGVGQHGQSRLFDQGRDGQTTNISAYFFAHGSLVCQTATVRALRAILDRQQRAIRQPLASTSNWAGWNDGLIVSMWVLIWTRWAEYYLRLREATSADLEALSQSARKLAMVRSMEDWKSQGPGRTGEMAAFLDMVEGLLKQVPSRPD